MPQEIQPARQGFTRLLQVVQLTVSASANPIGALAGGVEQVAMYARHAHEARRTRRAEALLSNLAHRLEHLEKDVDSGPHVDLFLEYLAKAVEDEDEAKTDLYAAYMTWVLNSKPHAHRARVLGEAIRSLTSSEIRAFIHLVKHGGSPVLFGDLEEDLFWNRLQSWGLTTGVRLNGGPTNLGRTLCEIWPKGAFE